MDCQAPVLAQLDFLEDTANSVSAALVEASTRFACLEQRGPLVCPNLQDAFDLTCDLENKFIACQDMIYSFLYLVRWNGPEMPSRKELWPQWWQSVRRSLAA